MYHLLLYDQYIQRDYFGSEFSLGNLLSKKSTPPPPPPTMIPPPPVLDYGLQYIDTQYNSGQIMYVLSNDVTYHAVYKV